MSLARRYELFLVVNRESSVEQVIKAYRKVLLKAHPDKGGRTQDAQTLQAAKETWAKNFAGRFRKACQQVLKRGGAAADN